MCDAVKITCVNHSTHMDMPKVFLFMKNEVPSFDTMKDAVAWRVVADLLRESSATFTFPHETMASASWNGGSCRTPMIPVEAGNRYVVRQDQDDIILAPDGGADRHYVIDVANTVHVEDGVSVDLYKNGRLMLTKKIALYGQEASFIFHRKLYWGLASEIQAGQPIGSAVLISDHFFELNLQGLTEVTVGLYGNPVDGYQFKIDSIK